MSAQVHHGRPQIQTPTPQPRVSVEAQRRAVRCVAGRARDAGECRVLLGMLGLDAGAGAVSGEHLYGVPGAEDLHDGIGSAYEAQIDPWVDEHDLRPWVIEEWTVHPPRYHLPSATGVVDWLVESAAEAGDMNEDAADALERQSRHPELLAAAEALLAALAARMTYQMADRKVAEHAVTFDPDGEPLVDGKPLYTRRRPTDIQEPA